MARDFAEDHHRMRILDQIGQRRRRREGAIVAQDQRLGEPGAAVGLDAAGITGREIQHRRSRRQRLPTNQRFELVSGVHTQGPGRRLVDIHLIGVELAQRDQLALDGRQWTESRGIVRRQTQNRAVRGGVARDSIRESRGLDDRPDHAGDGGKATAEPVCHGGREVGVRYVARRCLAGNNLVDGA